MLLRHYSAEPLGAIRSTDQNGHRRFKPVGLWVSEDSTEYGWRDWCEGEQWGLARLKYASDIVLRPDAAILILSTPLMIEDFTREYGKQEPFKFEGRSIPNCTQVFWERVAEKYQGIIIAPYCWELRLEAGFDWYYGWDCASGCIWDADAIESVGPAVPQQIKSKES